MNVKNTMAKGRMGIALILLSTHSVCAAVSTADTDREKGPVPIYKISETVTVDGKADEDCWNTAEELFFEYYYGAESPDDRQRTTLRLLWDDKNIYLFFDCLDPYLTARETAPDGQPYFDDCAEIFFMPASECINMHFGFEINLLKAASDFVHLNNLYHGKDISVKSYNPDYQIEVQLDGTLNDNSDIDKGWTMELAIPLKAFHTTWAIPQIKKGVTWSLMSIRKNRNDLDGNRTSWSTLYPASDEKGLNVHHPVSFGTMIFSAPRR